MEVQFKNIERVIWILVLGLSVFLFAYAETKITYEEPHWFLVLGAYTLALPSLLVSVTWVRVLGGWWAVLIAGQTLLSPYFPYDLKTLPPNISFEIDYQDEVVPGMYGLQRGTTDEKGFRVTPPIDYMNKHGAIRMFALGGSTTDQTSLGDENTWTHLVQETLKNTVRAIEVVNAGLTGTRARNHLVVFKHVLKFKPDIAMFLIGGNDALSHIAPSFVDKEDKSDLAQYWLHPLNTPIARFCGWIWTHFYFQTGSTKVSQSTHTEHWVKGAGFHNPNDNSLNRSGKRIFRPERVSINYQESLSQIAQVCKASYVKCLFIVQPNAYSPQASQALRERYWMTPPFESYTLSLEDMIYIYSLYANYARDFAKSHDIALCDLVPEISPSEENFYDDVHFNIEGSRKVAAVVARCLEPLL